MDDANGVRKVIAASRETIVHFLRAGKLSGMAGSLCESQPTMPSSRLVRGKGAKGIRSRWRAEVLVRMRDRRERTEAWLWMRANSVGECRP